VLLIKLGGDINWTSPDVVNYLLHKGGLEGCENREQELYCVDEKYE